MANLRQAAATVITSRSAHHTIPYHTMQCVALPQPSWNWIHTAAAACACWVLLQAVAWLAAALHAPLYVMSAAELSSRQGSMASTTACLTLANKAPTCAAQLEER